MNEEQPDKKVQELCRQNAALKAQALLLESFTAMIRTPFHGDMLNSCLQQTLELTKKITSAENGGIFLIDENGVVTDSILTRKAPVKDRAKLIGMVMDKGLAGWALKHGTHGVVDDADNDPRWLSFKNQPYAAGSALAAPIKRGGNIFGVLTLLHSRKRHFSGNLVQAVLATADQIALVLENVRLYVKMDDAKKAVEAYSSALDREMEKGRKIQMDFLPKQLPESPCLETAASFIPALKVSGDFYDAFVIGEGLVCFVIGDVSDKGVGSALFMALIRSLVRIFSRQCSEKEEARAYDGGNRAESSSHAQLSILKALDHANDYLTSEHSREGMFATVFFGILDMERGSVAYVSAGHPPVYVIGAGGDVRRLPRTGPAVGLLQGVQYQAEVVELKPGAIIFGYTDGVTEAMSPKRRIYGKERLESLISGRWILSANKLIKMVHEDLNYFSEKASQSDDITMLAVRWKGPS